ncbi:MAG: UvrD-helicase domain-containing protein [Candidatus Hydrogenedens sp.]|nr:UvrD-helicase domain-containing protein [Candidatus Hydrogenedens sp.]
MKFTKEQRAAIEAGRPVVGVSAGAGSGKTAILVERIFHLLSHPELWGDVTPGLNRIAAITFTNKAAAEMKARLRLRFRAHSPDIEPDELSFWRTMEYQVDSAQITTIHSFCAAILRENALHFQMDPDWKVLSDAESARLTERALIQTLDTLLESGNPAACRLSVLMPRHSIKEVLKKMLVRRWDYRAVFDAMPEGDAEALFTFWQERFQPLYHGLLRKLARAPQIPYFVELLQSFDGTCFDPFNTREQMRTDYIHALLSLRAGVDNLPEILTRLKADYPDMRHSGKNWVKGFYKATGEALNQVKRWMESWVWCPEWNPQENAESAQITSDFAVLFREADKELRLLRQEASALDFDDIINETLYYLKQDPALCDRVASSFTFLLIDEFQDTDSRQLDIAHLLADRPGGPSLFFVGDAKQSIYLFRGANVGLFNNEIRRDPEPVSLLHNFRTLPDVLHFINDLFVRSDMLNAVEAYRPMIPFRPSVGESRVECFVPAKLKSAGDQREQEARFIAQRIYSMCHSEQPLQLRRKNEEGMRPATYDDIVLLFRRGTKMHSYEAALREANIPYNRVAGEGFFKRREVLDVLAMLQLVIDPWDEEALLTVLRSPLVGLSDEDLMRLSRCPGGLAAAFHEKEIPENFSAPEILEEGRCLFEDLYERREWPPARWLERLVQLTRFEAILLDRYLGLQSVSNLRKLRNMAEKFSQTDLGVLPEFARYVEELSVRELREGDAELQTQGMGAVTLMTIHKSKGLEFPIVFLPELMVGTSEPDPGILCMHQDLGVAAKHSDGLGGFTGGGYYELLKRLSFWENLMERARILYVAMTRAREYLILCGVDEVNPFTWAGILNRFYGLPDRKHGEMIQGDGWNIFVHRVATDAPPENARKRKVLQPDEEAISKRLQPLIQESTSRKHISVSALLENLGYGEDEEEAARVISLLPDSSQEEQEQEPQPRIRGAAMDRGTLFHRLFELWDFQKDILPSLENLVFESGIDFRQASELLTSMRRCVDTFRQAASWPLFAQAESLEKEVPFMLNLGEFMLHGVVDVLIDGRILVDYKTGHHHPDNQARYESQLLLYGAALKEIRGTLPEKAILWYLDAGVFEEISLDPVRMENLVQQASASLMKS